MIFVRQCRQVSPGLKLGLHISRKDRKNMVANTFFILSRMPWSSRSCNDCRYSYFRRNICNRCVDSLKILFVASSGACSAIVTTIWRPGFNASTCLRTWNGLVSASL